MFKVEHIQIIRTKGCGVGGFSNGFLDLCLGERGKVSIKGVGFTKFTNNFAGVFVGLVRRNGCKLFAKGVGNISRGGVDFIRERNGLVCWRGVFLAGKGAKEVPKFTGIGAEIRFGKGILPLLLGEFIGEGRYFIIKDRDSRVGGVICSKDITFLDKGFNSRGEGRVKIFNEACRDRMFGGSKENISEKGFIFRAGGWWRKVFKKEVCFKLEGGPVCFRIIMEGSRRLWNSGEVRE